jgi:acetolactate synthase-1/2/3 large subunit
VPTPAITSRTGGEILVAGLLAQGASLAFGVPGESYLAVLDAMYGVRDRFQFIICRQEGGAAYMADAHGKLTGRPGLAFVTRGPGAANAAIGIHTAAQDSTPMIVFVGQVGGDMVDREAFQEIDYRQMYGSVAKWVAQIDRADRIPEYLAHAYRVAMSGRPGPVVLALPEDMLTARAACADAARVDAVISAPDAGQVAAARALLANAARPLVIAGRQPLGCGCMRRIAAPRGERRVAGGLRVSQPGSLRQPPPQLCRDVGIGINPKLAARVREADVLLVIGERLGEMTTSGYTLLDVPTPSQSLIHVHPGADELGRVYQPVLAINATPGAFLAAMAPQSLPSAPWAARAPEQRPRGLRRMARAARGTGRCRHVAGRAVAGCPLARGRDRHQRRRQLFDVDASSVSLPRFRTQLAPYSGAMGYGVPAAIAARAACPERAVVSWNGDGCFLMNGQELATAVQYNLAVIFVVIDNGMYGTIRMHQERTYPGRVSGTDLRNPDFARWREAYGAAGETVVRTDEFAPAFQRALAASRPALIHVRIDPQALTMSTSLDGLRAQGMAARS